MGVLWGVCEEGDLPGLLGEGCVWLRESILMLVYQVELCLHLG